MDVESIVQGGALALLAAVLLGGYRLLTPTLRDTFALHRDLRRQAERMADAMDRGADRLRCIECKVSRFVPEGASPCGEKTCPRHVDST